ncbi:MAG: Flp family type IVb pilin [Egibacteraceae bacterium]
MLTRPGVIFARPPALLLKTSCAPADGVKERRQGREIINLEDDPDPRPRDSLNRTVGRSQQGGRREHREKLTMIHAIVALQMLAQSAGERLRREDGATAVEYGLLVALIAAVIVGVVATLGGKISTAFTTVNDKLT